MTMNEDALGNWRCLFWHQWRYVWKLQKDQCQRAGCGEIREHKPGTKPA